MCSSFLFKIQHLLLLSFFSCHAIPLPQYILLASLMLTRLQQACVKLNQPSDRTSYSCCRLPLPSLHRPLSPTSSSRPTKQQHTSALALIRPLLAHDIYSLHVTRKGMFVFNQFHWFSIAQKMLLAFDSNSLAVPIYIAVKILGYQSAVNRLHSSLVSVVASSYLVVPIPTSATLRLLSDPKFS